MSGVKVTESSAYQLLSVYSSVRLISDAVATLPMKQYRQPADLGSMPTEIPLAPWMVKPNSDVDAITFQSSIMASLLLRGNAYIVPIKNDVGQVLELWTLHPDYVNVRRPSPQLLVPRTYYILGQHLPPGTQIIHIPGIFLPNALTGLDPITFAKEAFGKNLAAQAYGAKFFAQGAMPSGVIKSPANVSKDQAKELIENWNSAHGGIRNAMRTGVLSNGAEYQPIQATPDQAQFLQTQQYGDAEIERLFGMGDPFGSSHASMTYANVEQRGIDVTRFTLMPWVYRMEQAFSALLPRGQFIKWDMESLLRPDMETLYRTVAAGMRNQMITQNEGRALVGRGPVPGGDEFLPWQPIKQAATPTVRDLEDDEYEQRRLFDVARDEHGFITTVGQR